MTIQPKILTFRELMTEIDDDFDMVNATNHKRRLLYYTIKLDNRKTDIIARSALTKNNRPRLTLFIQTPQENNSYTMLYLSEIDIINILSTIDKKLYNHIISYLIKVYRNEIKIDEHTTNFSRENLIGSTIKNVSLSAGLHVIAIPKYKNTPSIDTSFGYKVSFQSFCDDISLILSTENEDKLKTIIIKYYVFSSLLREVPKGMPIPTSLGNITTISDIKGIYDKKSNTKAQAYDKNVFKVHIFDNYFKSLA